MAERNIEAPVGYHRVGMSSRLPAAARREQLLSVALGVFASEGFHGASMNDIADAAGVTKPVLYQHFESKNDLYLALIEDTGVRLSTLIEAATVDADGPRDQVTRGFLAYFRWVAADGDSFRLLFSGGARVGDEFIEAVQRIEQRITDSIAPLIRADIDVDHQRIVAHGIVGLAESISRRLIEQGRPFEPDVVAAQVAELVWAGLRSVHRVAV
jgi:AcrR family transcriptional regulator